MSSQRFSGKNVFTLRPGLDSSKAGADDGRDPPTGGGMEPPMSDYVTHAEFGAAMSKIDLRLDQTATKADLAEVRAEIHKWMLATVLTIVGTMLAAIFGVAQVMKPSAPAAQQSPIIINVPGAAPAPATAPPK